MADPDPQVTYFTDLGDEVEIHPDDLWLHACAIGERREAREVVGDVEHVRVIDRRALDSRTLAELIVGTSPGFRENLRVLLDLLEAEGIGVTERRGFGADWTTAPAEANCAPASGWIRGCEP
jgi:hypothetical protein